MILLFNTNSAKFDIKMSSLLSNISNLDLRKCALELSFLVLRSPNYSPNLNSGFGISFLALDCLLDSFVSTLTLKDEAKYDTPR